MREDIRDICEDTLGMREDIRVIHEDTTKTKQARKGTHEMDHFTVLPESVIVQRVFVKRCTLG